ncbi:MAG: DUF2089 domain-containing protein [Thermomicrobiales bacterium]|nr:DUF2089 domain-containing protein [Thermomicrobiales bacterium]
MPTPQYPVRTDCPTCGDPLHVTRLECETCGTAIEGHFLLNSLSRLPGDSLNFLESFIRNKGVIKDIEVDLGISYPTVRARLDDVVNQLGFNEQRKLRPSQEREERRSILERLSNGTITAETAATLMASLNERSQS